MGDAHAAGALAPKGVPHQNQITLISRLLWIVYSQHTISRNFVYY